MAGAWSPWRRTASLALVVLATLLVLAAWPRPSSAAAAATLRLRTVPHLANVRLTLDGRTYRTDSSGSVVVGTFAGLHRVDLQPPASLPGGRTARLVGWLGQREIANQITLPPGTTVVQVAFIVSRPVSVIVTDHAGRRVPQGEVTRVTISSSLGLLYTLGPGSTAVMLPINGIVHPPPGFVSVPVRYSARSVLVQGSDVVHRGSQTFAADSSGAWVIKALIFPLRIQVRDALFGFPVGHTVVLAPRFGAKRTIPLGPGHDVRVASISRGTYDLTAHGPGFGLTSVTTLSRPQDARVLLFSWADVAVVAAFALVFLVGLPLLGGRLVRRPGSRLLQWRERRVRKAAPAGAAGSDARARAVPPLDGRPSAGSSGRRPS